MENLHVVPTHAEHLATEDIDVLHAFILHKVGETLLLHASHIDDVCVRDDLLIKVCVLHIFDSMLIAVHLVFLWH